MWEACDTLEDKIFSIELELVTRSRCNNDYKNLLSFQYPQYVEGLKTCVFFCISLFVSSVQVEHFVAKKACFRSYCDRYTNCRRSINSLLHTNWAIWSPQLLLYWVIPFVSQEALAFWPKVKRKHYTIISVAMSFKRAYLQAFNLDNILLVYWSITMSRTYRFYDRSKLRRLYIDYISWLVLSQPSV